MKWIKDFQLFLFDLDGLLVNSEHLHFQAYINVLSRRGFKLEWDFARYCLAAHQESWGLREALYTEFPKLQEQEPNWNVIYDEKKQAILDLLLTGKVELMPGAQKLLEALQKEKICHVVVTNSLKVLTDAIKSSHLVLQQIPYWITREDYEKSKPHPEAYLKAIQLYGKKGDRIIGFEDTVKGLKALLATPALPVLICPRHHPQLESLLEENVFHFESLEEIPENTL